MELETLQELLEQKKRSEVKKLISAGKIKVNGTIEKDCAFNVTDGCIIESSLNGGAPIISEARSGYEYYRNRRTDQELW